MRRKKGIGDLLADRVSCLEVEVLGADPTGIRGVVKVRATLISGGIVRVGEVYLEDRRAAAAYAVDMECRKRQGLDPISGMDPVSCRTVGPKGSESQAPHFALIAAG